MAHTHTPLATTIFIFTHRLGRRNRQANKEQETHTHTFNSPLSETTRVSRYQKGKTNLDFTGARDSE